MLGLVVGPAQCGNATPQTNATRIGSEETFLLRSAGVLICVKTRPDVQYASRCVMNEVGYATGRYHWRSIVGVARDLRCRQRVWCFSGQDMVTLMRLEETRTGLEEMSKELRRRGTTCVRMIDKRAIETMSLIQKAHALSCAEAELYSSNRAAAGTLQTKYFMEEAGCAVPARVWSDSSGGFGIIRRTGCCLLRYTSTFDGFGCRMRYANADACKKNLGTYWDSLVKTWVQNT